MCGKMMMSSAGSYITGVKLMPSADRVKASEPLSLEVQFRVEGRIREIFNQHTWTEVHDRHDNLFRVKYMIGVQKSGGSVRKREVFKPLRFARKVSFYWSRNPKLQPAPPSKKIWAMIVVDDLPNLPESVEEARSLVFDVNRSVEVVGSSIGKGRQKLVAHATASWGRHLFTEAEEIGGKSEEVEIVCE